MKKIMTFLLVVGLAAVIAIYYTSQYAVYLVREDHRSVRETIKTMNAIAAQLRKYRISCGAYPDKLDDLVRENGASCAEYSKQSSKDLKLFNEWGKEFEYSTVNDTFSLKNRGDFRIRADQNNEAYFDDK